MNSKPFTPQRRGLSIAVAAALAIIASEANADGVAATDDVIATPSIAVTAKRLDDARNSLLPETGSSVYKIDQGNIDAMPLGDSTSFNQVLLQAPGVAQDSYGQLHVRGDHANLQYRINGVIIPESISGFGQSLDARFFDSANLLTGALPAQYGNRTAGIVDIHTKTGNINPGGTMNVLLGQYNTVNPSLEYGGTDGNLDYYVTGQLTHNDLGIESPTSTRNPLHDTTDQAKGFGYLSYLLDNDSRISLMLGSAVSHFQIPNNPGATPQYTLNSGATLPSSQLNETQNESTSYAVVAYQGKIGNATDYQVSLFSRYSATRFNPDPIGDLIYTGVASQIVRSNFSNGLQSDASYHVNDHHTVRYGLAYSVEHAITDNTSAVFDNNNPGAPISIVDNNAKNGTLTGLYVQDEWLVNRALTLNYGLRMDQVDAYISEAQISPRLGAVLKLSPQTTLHAGYARYFTPPPTELIGAKDIALFTNTSNAPDVTQNDTVKSERANYYDVGITHTPLPGWTIGLDGYYKEAKHLLDEGQFGSAIVFSPFNYAEGKVYGAELTNSYSKNRFGAYLNLSLSRAMGKGIESAQYNFGQDELDYIASHWVHLDHDQTVTASGGVNYMLGKTTLGANALFGSGLRSGFANTQHLPAYTQVNLSAGQSFDAIGVGMINAKLALLNVFDKVYEIRDGSGIGVGAPQFGQRRTLYLGISKDF